MAEALAAAEMVLAREQKLSALDGLAAAAAHGLGTPLATIAVVTKELMRDAKPSDPHYEDVVLLRAQAERCRHILAELAARGEQIDIIVSRLPVSHLIEEVVAPHRLVAVPIEVRTGPAAEVVPGSPSAVEPITERNPGVLYGLGNLLENAVDFADTKVEVDAHWSKDEVRIVIADDGSGFPALCAGAARRAVRHHAPGPELPSGGARRAYRHGARLLHRQDVARTVRRDACARQPPPTPGRSGGHRRVAEIAIRANVRRSPVQTRTCGTLAWARARFSARSAIRASR